MHNLLALFAFAVLVAFLAVLVIHVPRLDLTAVIGITVALAGWDLLQTVRGNRG